MFRATGPSGATPSSGGICASAVVVIVIADDDVIAATGEITDDDEDTSACNGAEGEGAAIELVMAFTVDVVLLMLLLMLLPAGREPPLPRPAVDAARGTQLLVCPPEDLLRRAARASPHSPYIVMFLFVNLIPFLK